MSPAEWVDIQVHGFRPGYPSFQGKWFAERPQDAERWGWLFYGSVGLPYHVIEVEVPDTVADQWHRDPTCDRIGPARFADETQLAELNVSCSGLQTVLSRP